MTIVRWTRRALVTGLPTKKLLQLCLPLALAAACAPFGTGQPQAPYLPATHAAQTAQVIMTRAAPTAAPAVASQAAIATPLATEPRCINAAQFLQDVTIQDGAHLAGGQPFVKIWRLRNEGTCTWTEDYDLVFIGGHAMGALPAVPLGAPVAPGETIDVAVDMIAPTRPGQYHSYWKLRSDQGLYFGFGQGGQQAIWVLLQVAPTVAARATLEPTLPAALAPTPFASVPTPLRLLPGQSADLDTAQLDAGPQADLRYTLSEAGASLTPLGETLVALLRAQTDPPQPAACDPLQPGPDPMPLAPPPSQGSLCYRTAAGAAGYLTWARDGQALELQVHPWAP